MAPVCTWVAMQGNSGKYGGLSKGKSPSQFVFVFICSAAMGGSGLSRITGHLGNEEGTLARSPGSDFLTLSFEVNLVVGCTVVPAVFILSLGTLPVPSI